ncbi:glycosyltransferase family 2 protein [Microbacterium tenebrionis]|uniref:glycosyltransferase family 2 protein n=1 Tax=Microbacterium tenebrionis TaxID=2830665 RepID=UPI001589D1FF|nr:glycosyltransferase family 2 protein [Microbacterium ihumii]
MADQRPTPEDPELSVVMPTKNVGAWVYEAIISILNQEVRSLELIVVDDGSTDNTLDVLSRIDDERVTVLSSTLDGGGSARNLGVSRARGEFLAFADGDDLVPSGAYTRLLQQARRTGVEMVVGNYLIFEPNAIYTRQQWLPLYGEERTGITLSREPRFLRDRVCWNRIFRRTAWDAAGIRFTDAPRSNDIVAMTDAYCAFEFDVVPEIVYAYRRRTGAGSMTARKHTPESIYGHFAQESICFESVVRLQNRRVTTWYATSMLENDVWAHLGPLTSASHLDASEYDQARMAVRSIVTEMLQYADASLQGRQLFTYKAIVAGEWALAAAFNDHSEATVDRVVRASGDALRRWFRHAGIKFAPGVAEILRWSVFGAFDTIEDMSDAELVRLVAIARELGGRPGVGRELNDRERQIASLNADDGPVALREALRSAPPSRPVSDRLLGYAKRGMQSARRVASAGARAARDEVLASMDNHPEMVHRVATRSPRWARRAVRILAGRSHTAGEATPR